MPATGHQRIAASIALGVIVTVIGLAEVWTWPWGYYEDAPGLVAEVDVGELVRYLLFVLGLGAAAGLSLRLPGWALVVAWTACAFQVMASIDILVVQFALGIVAFGTARYGNAATLWASGLSIPFAAVFGMVYARGHGYRLLEVLDGIPQAGGALRPEVPEAMLFLVLVGGAVLVVPWLVGLLLRALASARASRAGQVAAEADAARAMEASEQAREIAELRATQTRLARDVHDVVGHSLAVILAQAESARLLTESDHTKAEEMLGNIATTARDSLREVRDVLASTGSRPSPAEARIGELDSLVEGVRAAGNDVRTQVTGQPRPLPPELAAVAFRVLQEMLTNAIRHGRRDAPITVAQQWDEALRIEVHNLVDDDPEAASPPAAGAGGMGVDGMTRRLESVGGRLDVGRRQEDGVGTTWTATAWLPVRAG